VEDNIDDFGQVFEAPEFNLDSVPVEGADQSPPAPDLPADEAVEDSGPDLTSPHPSSPATVLNSDPYAGLQSPDTPDLSSPLAETKLDRATVIDPKHIEVLDDPITLEPMTWPTPPPPSVQEEHHYPFFPVSFSAPNPAPLPEPGPIDLPQSPEMGLPHTPGMYENPPFSIPMPPVVSDPEYTMQPPTYSPNADGSDSLAYFLQKVAERRLPVGEVLPVMPRTNLPWMS
jgi:hypothetical protein